MTFSTGTGSSSSSNDDHSSIYSIDGTVPLLILGLPLLSFATGGAGGGGAGMTVSFPVISDAPNSDVIAN